MGFAVRRADCFELLFFMSSFWFIFGECVVNYFNTQLVHPRVNSSALLGMAGTAFGSVTPNDSIPLRHGTRGINEESCISRGPS